MILYSLPMDPEQLRLIQDYGQQHRTPTVAVHSAGFYSYFTVQLPGAFPIVETHPDDTATADLRLLSPWPELEEYAKSMTKDIEKLDNHEHGHLPLVVILLHYLEAWKQNHNGEAPTKYADKTAFRTLVSDAMRKDNPEGGEENFEEAVGAVMKHIVTPSLPNSLKQVFDYQHQGSVCFNSADCNAYLTCLSCLHIILERAGFQFLDHCRRCQAVLSDAYSPASSG
jgi:NEDD8-activating enzyme E1 regulatory subunit